MKTIVGLYSYVSQAERVINDLDQAGFDRDDISLLMADSDERYTGEIESHGNGVGEKAAEGAAVGGVLGGITGLVVGLGLFTIPGIGPIVAAGPIATTLAGAGVGAVAGGVVGALVGWGVPEEEAGYYAEGVRRGGKLVAVKTPESRVDEVTRIMNRHNPIDLDERSEYWRAEGWTGYDRSADPYTREQMRRERERYYTFDEEDYSAFDPTYREHYQSNYASSDYDFDWYQPAYRYGYMLGTNRQSRSYDHWDEYELTAKSRWIEDYHNERPWDQAKDAVRSGWEAAKSAFSDDTDYDRTAEDMYVQDSDYDTYYDADSMGDRSTTFDSQRSYFRDDYNMKYQSGRYTYDQYEPAYRYGYNLGMRNEYRSRNWSEIEADARRGWESDHDGTWEDFKDAVRHAWMRTKQAV